MKRMRKFIKIQENIYRLKIPFTSVTTSVFLIAYSNGYILVDCATTEYDVQNYIIPALHCFGVDLSEVKYIVLSHYHEDHAGGIEALKPYCRNAQVVQSVCSLTDEISTYPMAGHTLDCIGVLDLRSKTLISADAIQGYGIGEYPCSTHNEREYLRTIDRVWEDERIENILFSHDYEPWNCDCAFGRENIKICLQDSKEYIDRRRVKK